MRRIRIIALALISVLAFVVQASASTVTFESFAGVNNPILSGSNDVEGLTFTADHYHIIDSPGLCSFGGCVTPAKYLAVDGPGLGTPVTVTRTGGGTFSVLTLDASKIWVDSGAAAAGSFDNADFLHLVGNINGGGTVTADLSLAFGFANFGPAGFTNLDSLVISGYVVGGTNDASWAVDNIAWSDTAVPEPSSMILLSTGLTGLLYLRRKR